MQNFWINIRSLTRDRSFAVTSTVVLTLAVGLNIVVFSALNATLLRPLPYPQGHELIWATQQVSATGREYVLATDFSAWRAQTKAFVKLAAFHVAQRNMAGRGAPERVLSAHISAEFLAVLQTQPALGRNFLEEEDRPGSRRVAILTYPYWRRHFGEDGNVIGQVIRVDDQPCEVVGVLPRNFQFPGPAPVDLLLPLALGKEQSSRRSGAKAGIISVNVIGRLKPGVKLAQAQSDLELIQQVLAKEFFIQDAGSVTLRSLHHYLAGEAPRASLFLMVAVFSFWLLSCLNVGSLMLARTISRRSEMAIRISLGATLPRLYLELVKESILLSLPGVLLGALIASWGRAVLVSHLPFEILGITGVYLDARVIAFALLILILTALVVGAIAAAELPRVDISRLARSANITASPGIRRSFIGIVIAELVLTVVFVSLGTAMIRSFWALRYGGLGFDAERILTLRLVPTPSRYPEPFRRIALFESIVERIRRLPGVDSVGVCSLAPPAPIGTQIPVSVEGRSLPQDEPLMMARPQAVNAEFFRTLNIRTLKGHTFTGDENENADPVVVVNYAFAKSLFGEEPFLGRRINFLAGKARTVIGIVENFKNAGLHGDVAPEVYLPYRQVPPFILNSMSILVRTSESLNVTSAVRQEIWAVDPDQPISEAQTMDERLNIFVDKPRHTTMLLAGFSTLALLVALIGVYGVVSFTSGLRVREIAIRIVVGAEARDVAWMIVRNMLLVSLISAALGIALAVLAMRLLASLLYGVTAFDAYTVAIPLVLSIVTSVLACCIPAVRAARIDPAKVLRAE